MSDQRFIREGDFGKCLGHVIEECGEVLAAAGKTARWGLDSYNPDLPVPERESNRTWLLREIGDLERALERLKRCSEMAPS